MSPRGKASREAEYFEALLTALNSKIVQVADRWPTTRYWTKASLTKLLRDVQSELKAVGQSLRTTPGGLLEWLQRLQIARELVAEGEIFYRLEFGVAPTTTPDPLELLMAVAPTGVICYSSAIAFHELTTQSIRQNHVALLVEKTPSPLEIETVPSLEHANPRGRPASTTPKTPRKPGKLLFQLAEVPYYSTKRTSRLVPGVQERAYGPRTRLRITTYEQTLLDTLFKPFYCGGPEVIFEAWQEATQNKQLNEGLLLEYLQRMNYPATARRLAVMLRLQSYLPGAELKQQLEIACRNLDREGPYAKISLLPGMHYNNLDHDWLVQIP